MVPRALRARVRAHLDRLYEPVAAASAEARLIALAEAFSAANPHLTAAAAPEVPFDETDVVLITYADQLREPGIPPVQTLHRFVTRRLRGAVTGVHLLPFYPSTSDDGFAVVDYDEVDPAVGSWADVEALAGDVRLMLDAVVNHVSASSPWFRSWCAGDPRYAGWFLALDPDTDVSGVTRPRAHPLLSRFDTAGGSRWVWTTFSADQVDLDYSTPDVLCAVTEVLLRYVAHGASVLRLDAVAYLWKRLGTACIHLPETHEVVRLWRTLLDALAPGTLLITETNVPHRENVSYFGDGTDEAHLVYQFPLAPLVLSAFHLADATTLREWAADLRPPSGTTAFFNFLGSHDGVGVRPAEGLLTPAEIDHLCRLTTAHGGGVSYKLDPGGGMSPYELNTVYFDALTEADSAEPQERQVQRFLSAQSILLALAGVPGIYVQGLLGSRNWIEGVEASGRLRSINRQKFELADLEEELDTPGSLRHEVFTRLCARIRTRVGEPAFHPNGGQRLLETPAAVFGLEREAPDTSSRVLCLHSLTGRPCAVEVDAAPGRYVDLADGPPREVGDDRRLTVELGPYGVAWLRSSPPAGPHRSPPS